MTSQDPYDVLELQSGATDDEIKKKWRELILKWHPDRNRDRVKEATLMTVKIVAAGEALLEFNRTGSDPNFGQTTEGSPWRARPKQSPDDENAKSESDQDPMEDMKEYYRSYFEYLVEYYRIKPDPEIKISDVGITTDIQGRAVIKIPKQMEKTVGPEAMRNIMDILFTETTPFIHYFNKRNKRYDKIRIINRDEKTHTFTLKRMLDVNEIILKHDIDHELMFVNTFDLLDHNSSESLRNLFYNKKKILWPSIPTFRVPEWFILNDENFAGATEQRNFVETALATPDYAFLDGPPGSGKTTVLAELVFQLLIREKKILVCASTNVAIDNLLERIVKEYEKNKFLRKKLPDFMPLRLGSKESVSNEIKKYRTPNFVENYKADSHRLNNQEKLDTANLVCGTAYAIHKHTYRDKKLLKARKFDYMILDEASKTTLSEFLVPAIAAEHWIISGDIRQLVPYTDSRKISVRIEKLIRDLNLTQDEQHIFLDMFMAVADQPVCVLTGNSNLKNEYRTRCKNMGIKFSDLDEQGRKIDQGVMVGCPESLRKIPPTSKIILRNYEKNSVLPRAWKSMYAQQKSYLGGRSDLEKISEEISWRLFQYPLKDRSADNLDGIYRVFYDRLRQLQQITMPSILELFQDKPSTLTETSATSRHMSEVDFEARHVLLSWQHRMHENIAEFSSNYVYDGDAMKTPDDIKRNWDYHYKNRLIWLDVKKKMSSDPAYSNLESNPDECVEIIREISEFSEFARSCKPRRLWRIAILPFYNAQKDLLENELAKKYILQEDTGLFKPRKGKTPITIKLDTVDSFQGAEADIVFLSLVKPFPTAFLDNPNRINVAITRARYLCVVVGRRANMLKYGKILKNLAKEAYLIGPNLAESLWNQELYDEVLVYCNDRLKKNNDDVDAQIFKMKTLNKLKRYNETIDFSKHLHLDVQILRQLAQAYSHLKNNKKTLECYEKVLVDNPNDFIALQGCVYVSNRIGEFGKAIKFAERAIAVGTKWNPTEILKQMGYAQLQLKNNKKALECYEKVLVDNPNDFIALQGCVYGFDHMKEYEKVIKCAEKAIAVGSGRNHTGILKQMGYAQRQLKNDKKALECYEKVLVDNPDDFIALQGCVYASNIIGKFEKAIEFAEKTIAVGSKWSRIEMLKQMGYAQRQLKNDKKALECYEKVLVDNPDDFIALRNCIYGFNHMKEYEKAIKCAEKAIAVEPGRNRAQILTQMGSAHSYLKNNKKALECYEKVLVDNPNDFFALQGCAYAFNHMKEYEKVIEYAEKSLNVMPKHYRRIDLLNMLSISYLHMKKNQKAKECLQMIKDLMADKNNDFKKFPVSSK